MSQVDILIDLVGGGHTVAELCRMDGETQLFPEKYLMSGNGTATKARQPIVREYLATLNAAIPLDIWQAICTMMRLSATPTRRDPRGGRTCSMTDRQTQALEQ